MIIQNLVIRNLVFIFGIVSLVTGIVGIFLPLLPTTPLVLLASWCFFRSSPRAHSWIYRQKIFAKPLNDWNERRAISRKNKILAVSTIILSIAVMWYANSIKIINAVVTAFLVYMALFISTRNE